MTPAHGSLTITVDYHGPAVEVDVDKIPARDDENALAVPDLGHYLDAPYRFGDDNPGRNAEHLFDEAVELGALVIPDGLTVVCSVDDDEHGSGFTLSVNANNGGEIRLATPWRNVDEVAYFGPEQDGAADPQNIAAALHQFAADINGLLACKTWPVPR